MLAGRRRHVAMLQFSVSRTRERGSDAMLRDADPRRLSRSGSRQNAARAKLCCDDRREDSRRIGVGAVTRDCNVGRT